jgi:serine peptidase DegS
LKRKPAQSGALALHARLRVHIVPTLQQSLIFLLRWTLVGLGAAGVFVAARLFLSGAPSAVAGDSGSTDASAGLSQEPQRSFADAVSRAGPAVVNIYTARVVEAQPRTPSDEPLLRRNLPRRVEGSLGSGVIVDRDGHLVTNHHVIQGADEIRVQLADGRVATPSIVGTDPDTDLAVLRVDVEDPPFMTMGRSNEVRAGDVVLAIGNPFGLSQTVTQGIVSATGRGRLGVADFEDFIQTDAAINFGNSGGALIDTYGELIGINTAVLSQALGTDGISFAIPVNMVRGVMDQIIQHGRVRRGWLGVDSEELPRAAAAALGLDPPVALRINSVEPQGPAALAGLRTDDLVTHLNGQSIQNAEEALNRVAAMSPGSRLAIAGFRGTQPLQLSATLDERPPRGGAKQGS